MKKVILLILAVLISGCEKNADLSSDEFNTADIRDLVFKSINNDTTANNRLGALIDYSLQSDTNYNSVLVDNMTLSDKSYYYILLEHQNPLYNRFAVYDSLLTPLLMDKSLNGNFISEKINAGKNEFIKIDEAYESKDTLLVNRVSLYSKNPERFSLALRTHTKFVKPNGAEYFQNIIEISDTLIKTKITGSGKFQLNNREDVFTFNPSEQKYTSDQNLFDSFIKNEIENFEYEPVKEQIKND